MSPNQQDQLLESLYYKEFEKRQIKHDAKNNILEEPATEAGRHTISETIKKFHEVRMPLLKDGTQKSYTRHLAYWESRIGDLTLEELNRKRLFEERELLQQTPYTKPNGQLCIRSNKTVNRYISALSALYSSAEKDFGWIDENTKHPTSTLRVLKKAQAVSVYL